MFSFYLQTGEVPSDPVDLPFIPEVDLSDKPWFNPSEPTPDVNVEIQQNMARALTSIPMETKSMMGNSIEDMLQECTWNGYNCKPRLVFSNKVVDICKCFNHYHKIERL